MPQQPERLSVIWSLRENAMAITKTDFMRGMQCRKMLWLDKHKPSLKIIPPEIQARLDAGNDFGDRAMGMFGPYEPSAPTASRCTPPTVKTLPRI